MKIALSGNVYAIADILETQEALEKLNHTVVVTYEYVAQLTEAAEKDREKNRKQFFSKLKKCDSLLVVNKARKGNKENYISGSSFLEMGFAHALGKRIFLLYGIPEISFKDEILAMKPKILNGDLKNMEWLS